MPEREDTDRCRGEMTPSMSQGVDTQHVGERKTRPCHNERTPSISEREDTDHISEWKEKTLTVSEKKERTVTEGVRE